MSKRIDIPVVIESGQKYKTAYGVTAIKDGIKSRILFMSAYPSLNGCVL